MKLTKRPIQGVGLGKCEIEIYRSRPPPNRLNNCHKTFLVFIRDEGDDEMMMEIDANVDY